MFGRKKKGLFGNKIEQSCTYCIHFTGGVCRLDKKGHPCGSFRYDPLKRTPDTSPVLEKHNPDEFKL